MDGGKEEGRDGGKEGQRKAVREGGEREHINLLFKQIVFSMYNGHFFFISLDDPI